MKSLRIRGIYTTALTKYFLDKGYKICQPSEDIQKRLKISPSYSPPDVDIKHLYNYQGISLAGERKGIDEVVRDLQETFIDIFVNYSKIELYGIYKGKKMGGKISLGEDYGYLEEKAYGSEFLVQVKEFKGKPILTQNISLPSDYVILIPKKGIRISRKIKGEERKRLYDVGKRCKIPEGYGILWRTASKGVDAGFLMREVEKLNSQINEIRKTFSEKDVGILKRGKCYCQVVFGGDTKKKLDFVRNNVTPTVRQHHKLKSVWDLSFAIDVFEELMKKYKIEEDFEGFVRNLKGPKVGDILTIEHIKSDGKILSLGTARVSSFKYPSMILERRVYSPGDYDGLDVEKEYGDRIVTEMREREWWFSHTYFSKDGRFKGKYYNICTPVEFYPDKVRYVDLEVDVVEKNKRFVVDEDKLEKILKNGLISEKLAEKAKEIAKKILEGKYE